MTRLTLSKALNEGLRNALENDPKVLIMGEDVGKLGGGFRHYRHRHRAGPPWLPAGVRDPVRRLRVSGVRPDRQPAGEAADALARPCQHAGHDPDSVWWRNRGGGAPQRVAGGALRAYRRPA